MNTNGADVDTGGFRGVALDTRQIYGLIIHRGGVNRGSGNHENYTKPFLPISDARASVREGNV